MPLLVHILRGSTHKAFLLVVPSKITVRIDCRYSMEKGLGKRSDGQSLACPSPLILPDPLHTTLLRSGNWDNTSQVISQ